MNCNQWVPLNTGDGHGARVSESGSNGIIIKPTAKNFPWIYFFLGKERGKASDSFS